MDFADARGTFDGDRTLGLLPVLLVACHDVAELLLQFEQLSGLNRGEIGVPDAPLPVVPPPVLLR